MMNISCCMPLQLLVMLVVANVCFPFALAFCHSQPPAPQASNKKHVTLYSTGALSSSESSSDAATTSPRAEAISPPLSNVERKAIQKFNTASGYDKLCKACPTRLQPRVDTLVEMILGLSDEDRNELMERVSKRLEQGLASTITSTQEVYKFQISAQAATSDEEQPLQSLAKAPRPKKDPANTKKDLKSKMNKTRRKFDYSKQGIVKLKRLLEVTSALLSTSASINKSQGELTFKEEPTDNNYYHEIDELKQMKRQELKMQRLKYKAQKAKFEQKLAKYRVKLYSYGKSS